MAINRIGTYDFAIIQGVAGILTDAMEVIERSNVDGTSIRGLGRRGQQFTLRTIEDATDLVHCRAILTAYETLVGADPVQLVVNDVDYLTTEGLLVAVLAVTPIRITKASSFVGGILPSGAAAVLYASWALKVIEA